jgi:PAS domain S-box-containing protein
MEDLLMSKELTYEELTQRIKELESEIDKRKQAKEALRDSEARLEALSEASFEAIFLSEKGVCLDQNKTAERIFGYTRAEAVGRHGTEWIVPEDRERVNNKMLSGYEKPYEVTALHKDGTTFPCEIQARMTYYQGRSIRITALRDITERKRAEEELRKAHDELEMKVEERTAELVMVNDMLEQEIEERKQIELALTERRNDLENKTHELGELNAALNVLLKRREQDKTDLEEKVLANVKELVFPYVEKLNNSRINDRQMVYLNLIKSNLEAIVKPFLHRLSSKYSNLTPNEIQVAWLVKDGRTTKEIAELLNSSTSAIDFHRNNLRKKLGLRNTKTNLRSFLLSPT